jgi:hypothetical protein
MKKLLLLIAAIAFANHSHAQLVPQTQLEQDIASISRAASGTTYYGQLLVTALNNAHLAVWSLSDDRLEAVLNHLGEQSVTGLVQLQSATATAVNSSLDAAGDNGPRAVVQPGREFSWDGGSVVLAPLPVAEPPTE